MADVDSSKLKPRMFFAPKLQAVPEKLDRGDDNIFLVVQYADYRDHTAALQTRIVEQDQQIEVLKHSAAQDLLTRLCQQLVDSGAENYQGSVFDLELGTDALVATVTLQWPDKPNAHDLRRAAEADRDALLLKVAELELLADDARGKRCPECSAPMVSLSTIDGGQRVCSGCDKVWSWHLKEGQPPLIGNNRMVKKV